MALIYIVLPRQTIFYDVVEYLYSNTMSVRLKDEMPVLLAPPLTQEIQREHVRIISEIRQVFAMDCFHHSSQNDSL